MRLLEDVSEVSSPYPTKLTLGIIVGICYRSQSSLWFRLRHRYHIIPVRIRSVRSHLLTVELIPESSHFLSPGAFLLDLLGLLWCKFDLDLAAAPALCPDSPLPKVFALPQQGEVACSLLDPLVVLLDRVLAQGPAVLVLAPVVNRRLGELARRRAGLVDLLPEIFLCLFAEEMDLALVEVLLVEVGRALDCREPL